MSDDASGKIWMGLVAIMISASLAACSMNAKQWKQDAKVIAYGGTPYTVNSLVFSQNGETLISGDNNNGVEYGRTPSNHVDANYFVGAQIFNFGVQDQTNVIMTGDFGSFSNSGSTTLLEADSTTTIETTEPLTLST